MCNTIPRATTPSIGAVTLGSPVTINCPRASSAFTHTLSYKFGGVITSLVCTRGTGTTASTFVANNSGSDLRVMFTLGLSLTSYSNVASLSVACTGETTQTTSAAAGSKTYYFSDIGTDVSRNVTVTARDSTGTAVSKEAIVPTIVVGVSYNPATKGLRIGGVPEDAETFRCSFPAKFDSTVIIRDEVVADYIIEYGCPHYVFWQKYHGGAIRCWLNNRVTLTGSTTSTSMGGFTSYVDIEMPVASVGGWTGVANARLGTGIGFTTVIEINATTIRVFVTGNQDSNSIQLSGLLIFGRWK